MFKPWVQNHLYWILAFHILKILCFDIENREVFVTLFGLVCGFNVPVNSYGHVNSQLNLN